MTDRLDITFEGPRVDEVGVPMSDLHAVVEHTQAALRAMLLHMAGSTVGRGRPPEWVRQQGSLRLIGTSPGSLCANFLLAPAANGQALINTGQEALDAILKSQGPADPSLPDPVRGHLGQIGADLSDEVSGILLGGANDRTPLRIGRARPSNRPQPVAEPAVLHGLLLEVNWERHTAQLHEPYGTARYVQLRFAPALDGDMRRLATQYVTVRGSGRISDDDHWVSVHVEDIEGDRSMWEPFDREAFLNNPNPRIFDPAEVVKASEPFDVDEFIRVIREGRDA